MWLGTLSKKQELLVLIFAGAISLFAFAPFVYSYVIILSILLLLIVINQYDVSISKKRVLVCGYAYGVAYFATQLYWIFYSLYKVIGAGFIVSCIAMVGFTIFLASYIAVALLTYVKLKTQNQLINLTLLFPSIWVFFEWLRGWFLSGFPWCEIGYTQANNQFFRGFYPLFGSYGVSWLVLSLSGALCMILSNKHSFIPKLHFRITLLYCVVFFVIGAFIKDVLYTVPYAKPIKVAILQGNISEGDKWAGENSLEIYKSLVRQAHADLLLIPETAIASFEINLPAGYLDSLAKIASDKNADLILGIPKIINSKNDYVNAAMLITNSQHPYYAKHHLVPYGEYIPAKWLLGSLYKSVSLPMVGFSSGEEDQAPLFAAKQRLAFNICYENGFNAELIKSAANSTLMVNLSDMVWYGNTIAKDEHLQLSQVRALENQRYFIQATNTGLSTIIQPNGKIQLELPTFKREILEDYVGGRTGVTPFEYWGNWFIISFCVLLILVIFLINKIYFTSKQK